MSIAEFFRRGKVPTDSSRNKQDVTVHITDTGRMWVDPNEVVKTDSFQKQCAAVSRLREAKEQADQQSTKQLVQDEVSKLGEQWKAAYEAFQEIGEKYNEALNKQAAQ